MGKNIVQEEEFTRDMLDLFADSLAYSNDMKLSYKFIDLSIPIQIRRLKLSKKFSSTRSFIEHRILLEHRY